MADPTQPTPHSSPITLNNGGMTVALSESAIKFLADPLDLPPSHPIFRYLSIEVEDDPDTVKVSLRQRLSKGLNLISKTETFGKIDDYIRDKEDKVKGDILRRLDNADKDSNSAINKVRRLTKKTEQKWPSLLVTERLVEESGKWLWKVSEKPVNFLKEELKPVDNRKLTSEQKRQYDSAKSDYDKKAVKESIDWWKRNYGPYQQQEQALDQLAMVRVLASLGLYTNPTSKQIDGKFHHDVLVEQIRATSESVWRGNEWIRVEDQHKKPILDANGKEQYVMKGPTGVVPVPVASLINSYYETQLSSKRVKNMLEMIKEDQLKSIINPNNFWWQSQAQLSSWPVRFGYRSAIVIGTTYALYKFGTPPYGFLAEHVGPVATSSLVGSLLGTGFALLKDGTGPDKVSLVDYLKSTAIGAGAGALHGIGVHYLAELTSLSTAVPITTATTGFLGGLALERDTPDPKNPNEDRSHHFLNTVAGVIPLIAGLSIFKNFLGPITQGLIGAATAIPFIWQSSPNLLSVLTSPLVITGAIAGGVFRPIIRTLTNGATKGILPRIKAGSSVLAAVLMGFSGFKAFQLMTHKSPKQAATTIATSAKQGVTNLYEEGKSAVTGKPMVVNGTKPGNPAVKPTEENLKKIVAETPPFKPAGVTVGNPASGATPAVAAPSASPAQPAAPEVQIPAFRPAVVAPGNAPVANPTPVAIPSASPAQPSVPVFRPATVPGQEPSPAAQPSPEATPRVLYNIEPKAKVLIAKRAAPESRGSFRNAAVNERDLKATEGRNGPA